MDVSGCPAYFEARQSRCRPRLPRSSGDHAADLEVAKGLARVVAQEHDSPVAAHVPLLGEAAHGVDPQALAVEVAPHDRRLRVPARCDRGERAYWRALGQVAVGRGISSGG